MKNHTFGISLISVLGVICAGLSTDAMAAGSVRALGGMGTYNGTSAAATSTRTAPARAGSLRVSPTSARLVTTTNNNTSSAATGSTTNITNRISQLETRVDTLEQDRPFISSGDDIVIVDPTNGEVSIDPDALLAALNIESGTDGREVELNYDEGTKILGWRYTGETDYTPLVNIGALVGDYASAQDLEDAVLALSGKQPKSTAAYNLGNADGGWTQMTEGELAALQSGITEADVAQINTNKSDIATLSGTLDELTDIEGIASGLVTNDDLTDALAGKQDKLTPAQLAAVNSGVTGTTVEQVTAHSNSIATLTSEVSGKADADSVYSKSDVNTLLSNKADLDDLPAAPVQSDWNETNESSLAYIANKPEIPEGVVVDSALSATSENAVQNKVIKSELDKKIPAGVIPLNNQYVLGYVNGVQMYIPIVDGDGNSGYPIIAATGEEVTE